MKEFYIKPPKNFNFIGNEPYPYQLESFVYAIQKDGCGLLLDMGLGKTYIAINVARYRIQRNSISKILIICPPSIMINWQCQISKYSEYKSVVISGTRDQKLYLINKNPHPFFIINYESLIPITRYGITNMDVFNTLIKLNPDMIIFDESAKYTKSISALRTQCAIELADIAKYKMILTGTLITNQPLDTWSQLRLVDNGSILGTNFYRFRNKFFARVKHPKYTKYFLRKEYIDILHDRIYESCIRFKKEDVLEYLPDKIFIKIPLIPDKEFYDLYNTVREQILLEIQTTKGNVFLNLKNILNKLLKLQQITSGFIKHESLEERLPFTPKLDALLEQIEMIVEAEESCIVWCRFLFSIRMIEEELIKRKIKCITMSGEDKDKYSKWKGFQKSKTTKIFIAQIESGGIGTELFKLDSTENQIQHTVFYENPWGLDVREQAIDRTHRIGQKSICRYVDIIIQDTIDEKILMSIEEHKTLADKIMEDKIENVI
jgi:SNF2 family DNA or RNA helicase